MSGPGPEGGYFPAVYAELRRLAASKLRGEAAGHTLNATALVHEAYLRLGAASFADRAAFFRAASVAMQRILVDHARGKRAGKRGGNARRLTLDAVERCATDDPGTLLDLAEAVDRLAEQDPTAGDVARLRLFSGLSSDEAAAALGISRASAFREWAYARAWLNDALTAGDQATTKPGRSHDELWEWSALLVPGGDRP